MKTLLLAAVLTAATSAVAAPGAPANDAPVAAATAPAVASPYDQLMQTARAQFEARDFAGAQKTTEQALALAKTPTETRNSLWLLAQSLEGQELYEPARAAWSRVIASGNLSPNDKTNALANSAVTYFKENNWEEGRRKLETLLADAKSDEQKFAIEFSIASSYAGQKNWNKARTAFEALAADPHNGSGERGQSQWQIGQIYLQEDDTTRAKEAFEKVLTMPGVSPETQFGAHKDLGEIDSKAGRVEDARREFASAREYLMSKGQAEFNANNWEAARAEFAQALQLGSPDPVTKGVLRYKSGETYMSQQNFAAARLQFQEVLNLRPDIVRPGAVAPDNSLHTETNDRGTASPIDVGTLLYQSAQLSIAKTYIGENNGVQARAELLKTVQLTALNPEIRAAASEFLQALSQTP